MKTVVISCPIATQSGYGNHSRSLVHSLLNFLDKDKWEVKIIPQPWGQTPMNALSANKPMDKRLIDHIMVSKLEQRPDVFIQITVPNEFQKIGIYNIGITAGIETTVIPIDWVKGCNNVDLIITPSVHAKKVIESSVFKEKNNQTGQEQEHKVIKPIEVLFEGFDEIYGMNTVKPVEDLNDQLEEIEEDFNFLFVGHWLQGSVGNDRKDIGMLIKTFLTIFKNKSKKPGLILKTSSASFSVLDRESMLEKIRDISKNIEGDLPNIYLLHGQFTDDEMHSLYNHNKVGAHISFTKGEGYGRPLLEASLSHKPVIASNWSGHLDFLKNGAILLGGKLTPVEKSSQNKFIIDESSWFTVNYSQAAQVMNDVFLNPAKYQEQADKQSNYNKNHFSEKVMDEVFAEIFYKYVNIPDQVQINLPKLKKVEESSIVLPKLT